VTVEPFRGPVDGSFVITVWNRTPEVFKLDSCAGPRVFSVADGREAYCPPPLPQPCGTDVIPPGGSLAVGWEPLQGPCEGQPPGPGLYEVQWKGFPELLPGRVELLPDAAHELLVRAEPPVARAGEKVNISVENTSGIALTFNRCCNFPSLVDPTGRPALCLFCLACIIPEELAPGQARSFEWTAGEPTCDPKEFLPGRYRIVWGGFRDSAGIEETLYSGVASVLVLPPEERRLDLKLSKARAAPGEAIEITAVNPLSVPVYHAFCCDTAIFIDAEGRRSPCSECLLRCAISYGDEIPPGQSFTREFQVPPRAPCGLGPGTWSVIWGPNFTLDRLSPDGPVYGYAELEVAEDPGEIPFRRGNCDGSADLELTDAVYLLGYLFLGGAAPSCPDACDADDSGGLDLTDAVAVLGHLFLGAAAPPPPFPQGGADPTADKLGPCR
ncbi:MAG: hypothetical protein ACRD2T_14755, partial [Thermoanaerobaculia bacterium]